MGYQFYNNWPYSYSYMPTMEDHVDPVNNTYFTGLHQELSNIEYYLGLQPQGAYANVSARLDAMAFTVAKDYSTVVVSTTGLDADYSDIQQAIDAVEALGGGRVLIREGTYTITSPLTVNGSDNIIIQGMGAGTIITSSSTLSGLMGVCDIGNQHQNIVIRDITFDGNSGDSGTTALLVLAYATKCYVYNCFFKDSDNQGIYFDASNYNTISSCFFSGSTHISIRFDGSSAYNLIHGCYSYSTCASWACFNIDGSNNMIQNNYFYDIYSGIDLSGNNNFATGNIFYTVGNIGIYLEGNYCKVSDNLIYTATSKGIYVDGERCNVSNNTLHFCADGIYVTEEYALVAANLIYNSSGYGIYSSRVCNITGNYIHDPTDVGIYVNSHNSDHSNINSNNVYSSGEQGIYVGIVDYVTIQGNTVRSCDKSGILLADASCCAITGNTLKSNGVGAGTYAEIHLANVTTYYSCFNAISGNAIDANGNDYGIYESDSNEDYNNVVGNVVEYAGTTNILLQGANSQSTANIDSI